MKFEYTAISIKGGNQKKFRGIIEAPSGEMAIMNLMQRNLYPITLREMSSTDVAVAGRLANYKKIKNALTPSASNVVIATPRTSRFHVPWGLLGWGVALLTLIWAISRL